MVGASEAVHPHPFADSLYHPFVWNRATGETHLDRPFGKALLMWYSWGRFAQGG